MRVLGRVERFRDRLQLEVRSLEAAEDADPAALAPGDAARRGRARRLPRVPGRRRSRTRACARPWSRFVEDDAPRTALRTLPAAETHHAYAGGLLEHTVGVATLCREAAQLHPRLRADLVLAAALLHDLGRTGGAGRGPTFRATEEGRLLGHVHLRPATRRGARRRPGDRGAGRDLHAIAVHHDTRGARTAEASVLYHANQLDATAATRPVE